MVLRILGIHFYVYIAIHSYTSYDFRSTNGHLWKTVIHILKFAHESFCNCNFLGFIRIHREKSVRLRLEATNGPQDPVRRAAFVASPDLANGSGTGLNYQLLNVQKPSNIYVRCLCISLSLSSSLYMSFCLYIYIYCFSIFLIHSEGTLLPPPAVVAPARSATAGPAL